MATEEDIDELDDAPDAEVEETEETVVDQATAARTIAELQAEIEILRSLETLALKVRRSGTDKKWRFNGTMWSEGVVGVVLARFTPSGERRNEVHYIVELKPAVKAIGVANKVP